MPPSPAPSWRWPRVSAWASSPRGWRPSHKGISWPASGVMPSRGTCSAALFPSMSSRRSSNGGDGPPLDGPRIPAAGAGEAGDEFGAEVGGIHDGVHMEVSTQLLQVDVLVVLVAELLDVGGSFLFGLLRDLIGEDGVHGGLGAHDGDAGRGQGEGGIRIEARPTHGVESRAIGLAHYHADAGRAAAGHGADHLGTMADDALLLHGAADHEARHVAEEHQRNTK